MAFKFPFKKELPEVAPEKTQTPSPREVKAPESKDDWSEKTATNWTEHSGFIENSKVSNFAPPPRLDPRMVPRPTAPVHGMDPAVKKVLTGTVLALGILCGLHANGVFDRKHKSKTQLAVNEPEETTQETQETQAQAIVPPIANPNAPVIVPPIATKQEAPRVPAQAKPQTH